MRITVDVQGNMRGSSVPLREGLNVFGKIFGRVGKKYVLEQWENNMLEENLLPTDMDASGVFVAVRQGKIEWAAPDICVVKDLFYGTNSKGDWILGDDFFEVAKEYGELSLHKENMIFFLRHGYFPPGQTFFKEILRVRSGNMLIFLDKGPMEESAWGKRRAEEFPRSYAAFKKAFSSVLKIRKMRDQDALLLSGGCDSGLLAALAVKELSVRPVACTSVYRQTLLANEKDVYWAKKVSEHLGLKHVWAELDFNKERAKTLEEIIPLMPLSAHFTIGFFRIYEEMHKRGVRNIWSGQNADSLYNFGPTSNRLGGVLKRWYLSKEYWKSFPDIEGNSPIGFFMRLGGEIGLRTLRLQKGIAGRQPITFAELLHTFEQTEGSYKFPKTSRNEHIIRQRGQFTYGAAKKLFFDRKLQTFLTGGDPRVHYALARFTRHEAMLPYAAANMIHFFRGLELNMRDVFSPKRYIYAYLEELLGKRMFRDLYHCRKEAKQQNQYMTWQEWQAYVLDKTVFGQELRSTAEKVVEFSFLGGFFDKRKLHHSLDAFWIVNIMRMLREDGISINTHG